MKQFIVFMATLLPVFSYAQFTGRVVNDFHEGIPHASISLDKTSKGVVTDAGGYFSIDISTRSFPVSLLVTSVGYEPRQVLVRNPDVNNILIVLQPLYQTDTVIVTSRRRKEVLQHVPVPVSVVTGAIVTEAGAFNVNRLKELVPSVQLYSSNPRNTTLNIRGQGSTFGLTNDGIEPGVGFYVDGVYYSRPAATTIDFIDVERIEVLRGPQGTLFGKNTTAGAFNISSRKPSFVPGGDFELSYGNYGYIQAKAALTGGLSKSLAGRLSFSGTQRDGVIENVVTGKFINDINNLGVRGQLLYSPSNNLEIILAGDASRQRPDGYAQVFAGVVPTLRPAYRHFEQIIRDLDYELPSRNPFDRKIDQNTPWRSLNDHGGVSLNADIRIGNGTLTSTSAWRYWKWGPSNDRDFTGLDVLSLSQADSKHRQWSQEIRYAGDLASRLSGVLGVFAIGQHLLTDPYHTEESGSHQWRFSQSSTSERWSTPGLFDGFGIRTYSSLKTFSGAVFGQLDFALTERLRVLAGLRYNIDEKEVDFNRQTYGGLQTDDPELIALKNAIYRPQFFQANTSNNNLSGQLTLSYKAGKLINTYTTYSTNYKSVGLNLGGLPTSGGEVMVELASIKPEYVQHVEVGIKTTPAPGSILNLTFYHTSIRDFQTQVQTPEPGVNRGYLANAEKVRIRGAELEGSTKIGRYFSVNLGVAYADGIYVSFVNAPVPLEETGAPSAFKDISGGRLPGISKWTVSSGVEYSRPAAFFGNPAKFFIAADSYYRSEFSSSPSPSTYLNIDAYALVNARLGFRQTSGLSAFIWSRNVLDKDYFEQLLPASGGAGHYGAVLGDPRTFGLTLRYSF